MEGCKKKADKQLQIKHLLIYVTSFRLGHPFATVPSPPTQLWSSLLLLASCFRWTIRTCIRIAGTALARPRLRFRRDLLEGEQNGIDILCIGRVFLGCGSNAGAKTIAVELPCYIIETSTVLVIWGFELFSHPQTGRLTCRVKSQL